MTKTFISANEMEQDAWNFAIQLFRSNIHFDWIIGVTRGGAQISIYVQEALTLLTKSNKSYGTIHATSYTGISTANTNVEVLDPAPLLQNVNNGETILLLDDIFERGVTLNAIKKQISPLLASSNINLYIATLYYKKGCNTVDLYPDFYYKTFKKEEWIVFPHEVVGLSKEELQKKGFPIQSLPEFF